VTTAPRRGKGFAEKVLVPLAAHSLGARAVLHLTTRNSGQELACGIDHRVDGGTLETTAIGGCAQVVVQAALEAGHTGSSRAADCSSSTAARRCGSRRRARGAPGIRGPCRLDGAGRAELVHEAPARLVVAAVLAEEALV
jgi:hypothetical protein